MSAVSAAIRKYYVTSSWVAEHYGVTRMAVHRAVMEGKPPAVRARGAKRDTWLFHVDDLPDEFPK